MSTFKAVVIEKNEAGQTCGFKDLTDADLMDGDVTVRVTHSTVNYKDGLAITGKAPIARRFPLVPGIDLAGIVESSQSPDFKPGDEVILNGFGVGEGHFGGYAERARLRSEWLIHKPDGFTAAQCMAVGTAGFTAVLCVQALERFGLTPDKGPVVVTGAAGGVGSVAVTLLARAGWHVVASTGRPHEAEYLKGLGAAEIVDRAEFTGQVRPLARERFAAGVDSVGSTTLANILSMTKYHGAVAACGLAGGMDLPATVAPFILRGVALLGIDSVMSPRSERIAAWDRLAKDLDKGQLAAMTTAMPFDAVLNAGRDIVAGKVRGRLVVEIGA